MTAKPGSSASHRGMGTLMAVNVDAQIHDLMSDVTIRQTYRNDEHVNIEAVFRQYAPLLREWLLDPSAERQAYYRSPCRFLCGARDDKPSDR